MPSTSLTIRPLKRSTLPLVCGVRGRACRYCGPSSAQALAKAGVKQLPLSVSTWVSWERKAAAASRRKARALRSVSVVLDGEVDKARATVDGDEQVALALLAVTFEQTVR